MKHSNDSSKPELKKFWKDIWRLSKPFRTKHYLIIFFWICMIMLVAIHTKIYQLFIDSIVYGDNKILEYGILLLVFSIILSFLNFYSEYILNTTQYYAIGGLWKELFIVSLNRKYSEISKGEVSRDMVKILSDTEIVGTSLGVLIPSTVVNIVRFTGYCIILFSLSRHLSLVVLVSVIPYYLFYRKFSPKLISSSREERVQFEKLFSELREKIQGAATIKKLGKESYFSKMFSNKVGEWFVSMSKLIWNQKKYFFSYSAVSSVMPIAILIVGGYMIYVKMLSITIGTLLAFVRLCGGIYEPLSNLSNNLSAISRVIPPLERIQNILSLRHTEDVSQKLVLEKFNSIEYNNVTLGYDNTQILTINYLEIRKRDRILIKGQSGSGKSTLVLSMVGLLKPLRGKILLNGISVEQYDLRSVLSKVAIVGSEEMLFTGTVKENILLGEIYLENKLDKVLKLCQIDDLAPDTSVSSGGMNISHGQRQRVALARALIREPDVLILDEALSGVDRDREKKILKGILSEFPDITIIYISHRDAPFDFASKIVTINNGQAMFK